MRGVSQTTDMPRSYKTRLTRPQPESSKAGRALPASARRIEAGCLPLAGCAPILALPAALCAGLPALAQTSITANQPAGVTLNNLSAPVSIAAGVVVSAAGGAAVSADVPAQLFNAGQVEDEIGIGVRLGAGGSLTNSGAIQAGSYGVLASGSMANVVNSGRISAGDDGISLNRGGDVSNSGTIFGAHIGVYTGNGLGSVENSGTISAQSGDAVSLYSGGSLTNAAAGLLLGGYSGVYAGGDGSTITNAGVISGQLFGAYLMGNSSISNNGALIGGQVGIIDIGSGGVIENIGSIHGAEAGIQLARSGIVENEGQITSDAVGIKLGKSGQLSNAVSGLISGASLGVAAGEGDVIVNAGTIAGLTGIQANGAVSIVNAGVISGGIGGDAISLNDAASTLILGTGSVINGPIAGNGTASMISLTGSGNMASDITGFSAGRLNVQSGAVWTVSGSWQIGQVVNAGTLQAGLPGTPLQIEGDFTQTPSGTLRVAVTPAGMNQLIISGTAHLAGTLAYVLSPGTYRPGAYEFLTASGGVAGGFSTIEVSDAPKQSQVLQVVTGSISATQEQSSAPQNTGNQAAASQLLSAQTQNASTQNLDTQSLGTQSLGTQILAVETVESEAGTGAVFVVPPADAALFAQTGQELAMSSAQAGRILLAHAIGGQADCASLAPQTQRANPLALSLAAGLCRAGGWVEAASGIFTADGTYETKGGGFMAGLDRAAGPWRAGLAAGYDSSNLKDQAQGKASFQTVRLGLYASLSLDRFLLSAAVMESIASISTTRQTGWGGAGADGNGNAFTGIVQAALPVSAWQSVILPAAGLEMTHISLGALNEDAALQAFAVRSRATQNSYVTPFLRVSIAHSFLVSGGWVISPDALLGLRVNATSPGTDVRLRTQDGSLFTASAPHLSPVSGQVGLGLAAQRGMWRLSLRYNADLAGNWHAQALQANLQARF